MTYSEKIWMFRRMISCRMSWSFLVTAIRHFIFLHVCFLLLFWRECRILLIISQIFLLLNLYSMPIFHRSLFKFMGVRYCWGCYCLFWYNMVWNFLKITKLFRSDGWHPLLTNAAKSHAINHCKGCIKLADKYQRKPSPTFCIGNIMIIITEMP